jgi:hypothetical protein
MRIERSKMIRMVKGVLAAPDDALACEAVSGQLPGAVDAAVAGEDVSKSFPGLAAHLEMCSECHREFEDLLEITQMAEAGALPELGCLPQLSLEQLKRRVEREASAERGRFLARFRQYLEAIREGALEPGIEALGHRVREGTSTLALLIAPVHPRLRPVVVRSPPLPEGSEFAYPIEPLDLQITLKVREFERRRFTLRGLIESEQELNGLGVCLLSSDDELLDCTQVDEANTFSFHGVGPGHYVVRLDFTAEEALCLTDVDI